MQNNYSFFWEDWISNSIKYLNGIFGWFWVKEDGCNCLKNDWSMEKEKLQILLFMEKYQLTVENGWNVER